MRTIRTDTAENCLYHAPDKDGWYDPRIRTVHIAVDKSPESRSRETVVSRIASKKPWVFDHELWHSKCNQTAIMEAIFLLNSCISFQASRGAGPCADYSFVARTDRYLRQMISAAQLPMEAYALTNNPLSSSSIGVEWLERDIETLASQVGRQQATALISRFAWKALQPELSEDDGDYSLIERIETVIDKAENNPKERFLAAMNHATGSVESLDSDAQDIFSELSLPVESRENPFDPSQYSYTDDPERTASMIVESIYQSDGNIDERFLDPAEWSNALRPNSYWCGFIDSVGIDILRQIFNEIEGPLYYCLHHSDGTLYLLSPDVLADSIDHEVVHTLLSNHFKKEAYLQNDVDSDFKLNKITTDSSVDYVPYGDSKTPFTPSHRVNSFFDIPGSSSDEMTSLLRVGREKDSPNRMYRLD